MATPSTSERGVVLALQNPLIRYERSSDKERERATSKRLFIASALYLLYQSAGLWSHLVLDAFNRIGSCCILVFTPRHTPQRERESLIDGVVVMSNSP